MTYYEDEILRELNIGKKYTQKQLSIFVVENINTVIISKTCNELNDYSQKMHEVIEIIKGYEHKGDRQRTYHIPSSKTTIYIVD